MLYLYWQYFYWTKHATIVYLSIQSYTDKTTSYLFNCEFIYLLLIKVSIHEYAMLRVRWICIKQHKIYFINLLVDNIYYDYIYVALSL